MKPPAQHWSESLDRLSSIDALRGLAALAVVVFHVRPIFWAGMAATYHLYGWHPDFSALVGYLSYPCSFGDLGVALFFVLSGYCIHRRNALALAKNPSATLDLRAFLVRRFWRIYPTYVGALVLTAVFDVIAAHYGHNDPGFSDTPYTFVMNLLFLQGYTAPFFGSNFVVWTLAMEVHLYLAYPILFAISRRLGPRAALSVAAAVSVAFIAANFAFHIQHRFPYRFTTGPIFLPYWFTWAAGFYLAEIAAGRASNPSKSTWWILALCGAMGGMFFRLLAQPESASLFWALTFAAVVHGSLQPWGLRLWNGRLGAGLAFVGVFSYSLYAIHAPALQLIHALVTTTWDQKFVTIWPAFAAAAAAVVIAWAYFQLVERQSIRHSTVRQTKARPAAASSSA